MPQVRLGGQLLLTSEVAYVAALGQGTIDAETFRRASRQVRATWDAPRDARDPLEGYSF